MSFTPSTHLIVSQQLEEMRATVEDLEAIKELNDELEENHVETEAQLLEELGAETTFALHHNRLLQYAACRRQRPGHSRAS